MTSSESRGSRSRRDRRSCDRHRGPPGAPTRSSTIWLTGRCSSENRQHRRQERASDRRPTAIAEGGRSRATHDAGQPHRSWQAARGRGSGPWRRGVRPDPTRGRDRSGQQDTPWRPIGCVPDAHVALLRHDASRRFSSRDDMPSRLQRDQWQRRTYGSLLLLPVRVF